MLGLQVNPGERLTCVTEQLDESVAVDFEAGVERRAFDLYSDATFHFLINVPLEWT